MSPDDLNSIDGGRTLSIGQTPVANILQEAAANRRISETEKTIGKIAEQVQGLDVQVKQTLKDVTKLKSEAEKLNENASVIQQDTKDLQEANKHTNSLVVLGLWILALMLAAIIITVTIYEIQTINQNNEQIKELLKSNK